MAEPYVSLFSDKRNDFDSIDIRKQTYLFYPQSEVPAWAFIDAGFFYVGDEDISQCFRCGLKIHKLRLGEDPFMVHRFRNPNCTFIKQKIESELDFLDDSDESDENELNFDTDSDWEEESIVSGGEETASKNVSRGIIFRSNLQTRIF